jgi:predicted enzyme related to lactoylglutathione lyase
MAVRARSLVEKSFCRYYNDIMIRRFDRIDVATTDINDAASIYEKNFGFKVTRSGETASVSIGGAEIRLASGASVADAIKANGEGMFAVWLEANDLDQVVAAFKKAGLAASAITKAAGRRVLAVDPKLANQVPLFIFDRKS